jgi:hypothetical protein
LQFLRFISKSNTPKDALNPACGASRDRLKPSGLTSGTTIVRVALTSCVVRALVP